MTLEQEYILLLNGVVIIAGPTIQGHGTIRGATELNVSVIITASMIGLYHKDALVSCLKDKVFCLGSLLDSRWFKEYKRREQNQCIASNYVLTEIHALHAREQSPIILWTHKWNCTFCIKLHNLERCMFLVCGAIRSFGELLTKLLANISGCDL